MIPSNMIPKVGEQASLSKTITDHEIKQFAMLSEDHNPVHLDEEFARRTRLGRRVAHGMLGASLISAVIGTKLPGPGSIYLSQTLRFLKPVYIGDTITAQVTVIGVREDKPIITLETVCYNQDNELVITGEAVILFESTE